MIAEILRVRGNRGELAARSQTDVPGRLEELKEAWVHLADGADERVRVEDTWEHKGDWVLKFAGVDSISAAERFERADVWIEPEQRGELAAGEFYQSDLIGCQVIDEKDGVRLGVIGGWQHHGGAPLMEVEVKGRQVLIPFVAAYCSKVDLEARSLVMNLPDGLLDL